ncbi:aminopeptidase [Algoriphagus confluentis]|uniref:M42 family metallopeptidase n=1 Tax=Algoriphagus confluentis TaxID=1697556 RepID=A0ABQ6PTH1_9BACT|nr:M42 family metallopeptidase [Algoriphagus confluentis]
MEFLRELLSLSGVSGDESLVSGWLQKQILQRKGSWKVCPEIYSGENFHDAILLKFGTPRTAVFAHMDTIGFMVRYNNQLIPIGGPEFVEGAVLVGKDRLGDIRCRLIGSEDAMIYDFPRAIERGTRLTFEQDIRISPSFIQAAYLDNRLGVYNALQLCETLEHGWVVFTTYEEHGGGSVPFLLKFLQETAPVKQALISDITWITEGIRHHEGVVISLRDKFIPRRKFLDRILALAEQSKIPHQLEVEAYGGSDGREVQFSPYAIDWCFIGAAEDQVHSPDEKVSLGDLDSMISMYQYLMKEL